LKDKTDKQCSAVEVFTLSIRAFVDRLMKMLERQGTGLSVPAAWTDSAKQLMRESAKQTYNFFF
jgi:hypothetical protein